jgi:formylglycine-generating enzyme required for sulfatase activity
MATIFLSYSRKDIEEMRMVKAVLEEAGISVWTDEDLSPGTKQWVRAIDSALRDCQALVVVMTPDSYNSEWVEAETTRAKELGRNVYPLLLRGEPTDSVPLSLVSYQRIDLRNNFQEGIRLLLRELAKQGLTTSVVKPPPKPAVVLSEDEGESNDVFIFPPESEQEQRKPSWFLIGLGILLIVICVGAGFVVLGSEIAGLMASETSTSTSTVTQTSTDTPTDTLQTPTPTTVIGFGSMIREKDNMEMAYIPAGEFEMGANADEGYKMCQEDREDCDQSLFEGEDPLHTVYLDAFWIDKYEVTNAQFAAFLNEMGNQNEGGATWLEANSNYVKIHKSGNTWLADGGYEDHPVVEVSWYGAAAYAEWVGGRLPTEAEWEKASRGGLEGQLYSWGDEDPVCTLGAENGAQIFGCAGDTVEVGSFVPNRYGLFDMTGNVYEWVADWYGENYYSSSPAENPPGPSSGTFRVLRGGAFSSRGWFFRCAFRNWDFPHRGYNFYGFRVVVSP